MHNLHVCEKYIHCQISDVWIISLHVRIAIALYTASVKIFNKYIKNLVKNDVDLYFAWQCSLFRQNYIYDIIWSWYKQRRSENDEKGYITVFKFVIMLNAQRKALSYPEVVEIGNHREGVLDEIVYPIKMLMKAVEDCSISAWVTH